MKKFCLLLSALAITFSSLLYADSKRIVFIRHGHALHNQLNEERRSKEAKLLRDPKLTQKGVEQAKRVRESLLGTQFQLVAISPMTRTLQTASIIFDGRLVPSTILTQLTEICEGMMCVGSERLVLESTFPQYDFRWLPPDWVYRTQRKETAFLLSARVEWFKNWLLNQSASSIAVISHAGFLRGLVGVPFHNCEQVTAEMDEQGAITVLSQEMVEDLT